MITMLPASDNKRAIISAKRTFSLNMNRDASSENRSENALEDIDSIVIDTLRKSMMLRREPELDEIVHKRITNSGIMPKPGKIE